MEFGEMTLMVTIPLCYPISPNK